MGVQPGQPGRQETPSPITSSVLWEKQIVTTHPKSCSSRAWTPPQPSGFLGGQLLLPLTQQGFYALHVVPTHGVQQWCPSILSRAGARATNIVFSRFSQHAQPSNLMWFFLLLITWPNSSFGSQLRYPFFQEALLDFPWLCRPPLGSCSSLCVCYPNVTHYIAAACLCVVSPPPKLVALRGQGWVCLVFSAPRTGMVPCKVPRASGWSLTQS